VIRSEPVATTRCPHTFTNPAALARALPPRSVVSLSPASRSHGRPARATTPRERSDVPVSHQRLGAMTKSGHFGTTHSRTRDGADGAARYFFYKLYEATAGQPCSGGTLRGLGELAATVARVVQLGWVIPPAAQRSSWSEQQAAGAQGGASPTRLVRLRIPRWHFTAPTTSGIFAQPLGCPAAGALAGLPGLQWRCATSHHWAF
jgi:hypothetical protein